GGEAPAERGGAARARTALPPAAAFVYRSVRKLLPRHDLRSGGWAVRDHAAPPFGRRGGSGPAERGLARARVRAAYRRLRRPRGAGDQSRLLPAVATRRVRHGELRLGDAAL